MVTLPPRGNDQGHTPFFLTGPWHLQGAERQLPLATALCPVPCDTGTATSPIQLVGSGLRLLNSSSLPAIMTCCHQVVVPQAVIRVKT